MGLEPEITPPDENEQVGKSTALGLAQALSRSGESVAQPGRNTWDSIPEGRLNERRLAKERIITLNRRDPGHVAIDMMRTRLRTLMKENGWTKVGITSPTPGCGKTFMSINLAFSLTRNVGSRTVLLDLDMKSPSVARYFGYKDPKSAGEFLIGETSAEDYLVRFGDQLAVGMNTVKVNSSSEILSTRMCRHTIDETISSLEVEAAVIDLPPLLSTDDALAALPLLDCVVLVIASGHTRRKEVLKCERLLEERVNFVGCVINKCEERLFQRYYYN